MAVVLVHDAVHDREPHSGALARLLGREEGLEDPLRRGGVDARAVVGDAQLHVVALHRRAAARTERILDAYRSDLDDDASGVGQCVARIEHQVEQHLFDLDRVDAHDGRRRVDPQVDDDSRGQVPAQRRHRVLHQGVEPQHAR